ncbi:acyl transferase [Poritiphilus flavus]|uniref:Acyl transferase n=1 Tax=Poritiphilus flavus TaxID=2697053 RepID=A0A6L9EDA6_9FLAO|nr:acyl transferase [Poritiphilus flavus]NAS12715.1 acyl transferase [Poritiphilus flavus]
MSPEWIFDLTDQSNFDEHALEIFQYQYRENPVYQKFCRLLGRTAKTVKQKGDIPFLPIEFFRSHRVISGTKPPKLQFKSSGTTGNRTSTHFVSDADIYQKSYLKAFELFYGSPRNWCILALLPSYLERRDSSLIYMVNDLIAHSSHPESGFYLRNIEALKQQLLDNEAAKIPTLLLGVSFALLDMAENFSLSLEHTVVMETGGMKGRRNELIREELHLILKEGFGVSEIHSEYGMTELLSQAYSRGNGKFSTPPWMQISVRDPEDPLSFNRIGQSGGINVIDLANINSCSFIATQDLGKVYEDGSFEVLGRFDHSDIRGCNLMVL